MTKSFVAIVALSTAVVGCGASDDEDAGLGARPIYPVPGCEHVNHRPCDIRNTGCQERLMTLAACLRGSEPIPVPPVTTMTETEFAAFLNAQVAENPPPVPNPYEAALVMLRIVQPGALGPQAAVARDVERIYGLYRDQEKDVIIVDHGTPSDEPDANGVLVHEFVHALQDADVDLNRYFEEYATSYDSYLAAASVSEGEARMHQTRFWASLLGLDPAHLDWTEHFQEVAEWAEGEVLMDPSPYLATYSYFQYELGARFVHHAWLSSQNEGVDALFASPPTRTQAVMASVEADAVADWPESEFVELEPPAPWELSATTSLGAWGWMLFLSRFQSVAAHDLALEWRGDRLDVYVAGDTAETAIVWHADFSTESSAALAEVWVPKTSYHVARDGSRLVIAASNGFTPVDWALTP